MNYNRSSKERNHFDSPLLDRFSYIHFISESALIESWYYNLLFSALPAPVPLYLLLVALKL